MLERAIITSCSNKFFPSMINLLGSIKANYPNHPKIFIYDLGLFSTFRRELEMVENVEVVTMPAFCGHWRSCYTWKTYIFAHPLARLNFYLDAGCQLLKPLDEDFDLIEKDDLLLIDQGQTFKAIVPRSYKSIFEIDDTYDELSIIHAGIIGFKDTPQNKSLFTKVYNAAYTGLALGFSPNDNWRNKGKDKTIFVRDCDLFRHDLTLLNIFVRKMLQDNVIIHSLDLYHGKRGVVPEQRIWQLRLSYVTLEYIDSMLLHNNKKLLYILNRNIIHSMLVIKNINLFIKRKLSIIKS